MVPAGTEMTGEQNPLCIPPFFKGGKGWILAFARMTRELI
jgi:hypothetical protein